eukprot:GHVR01090647.1.p1 GENE.GHVR01090647.1~~GHVR01090647.1.p1  ORF type:complete len:140 (-),score=32.39 GHVR01090647.1:253-672(-)
MYKSKSGCLHRCVNGPYQQLNETKNLASISFSQITPTTEPSCVNFPMSSMQRDYQPHKRAFKANYNKYYKPRFIHKKSVPWAIQREPGYCFGSYNKSTLVFPSCDEFSSDFLVRPEQTHTHTHTHHICIKVNQGVYIVV